MRYLKRKMLNNEYIIRKSNLSNIVYLNEIFIIILNIIYLFYVLKITNDEFMTILIIVPSLLIAIFLYIIQLIKDLSTELILTNYRIIGRMGLFKTKFIDCLINNIDNIYVETSFLGDIFKYGNISFFIKNDVYKYKFISNPEKFKIEMLNLKKK